METARSGERSTTLATWPWAERLPWAASAICAVLLLLLVNPKTVWLHEGGTRAIQGWDWQSVANWTGALALAALLAGLLASARWLAVACAMCAAVLFGIAAGEAARTWIDLTREVANPAPNGFGAGWTVVPATGMERTVVLALVGATAALMLAGTWTKRGGTRQAAWRRPSGEHDANDPPRPVARAAAPTRRSKTQGNARPITHTRPAP